MGDGKDGCPYIEVDGVGAAASIERVIALRDDEDVVPAAALQNVVARATVQSIGSPIASKYIISCASGGVFHGYQRVGQTCAGSGSLGQIDADASLHRGVGGGVRARTSVEHVGAGSAVEDVVPGTPQEAVVAAHSRQNVVLAVAFQGIVAGPGDHALDRDQVFGLPWLADERNLALADVGQNFAVVLGVIRDVGPFAAIEPVSAAAPGQEVIAGTSKQFVVAPAAKQAIIFGTTREDIG